jgi:hypothetical protein
MRPPPANRKRSEINLGELRPSLEINLGEFLIAIKK